MPHSPAIDWPAYEGRECWGGLDLSSTSDLTAFALVFPNDLAGFDVLCRFWLPGESAEERARRDRVSYPQWIREGWIEKTEGARIDYEVVESQIRDDAERFRIAAIAYDPPFAQMLAARLYADGNGLPMVAMPNTHTRLNEASKRFESMIVERTLRHDGNPVLRWCVANVSTSERGDMILPSKSKSTERIDGVAATVMALAVAGNCHDGPSPYLDRGILTI